MKIVLATHFFPPAQAGGTELYTFSIARMLRRMGHSPFVICAEDWGLGTTWEPRQRDTHYQGIPVRRLSWNWQLAPNPFRYLYDNPAVESLFEDYLRDIAPDLVHITSCYSLGAGIIRASRRAGLPTIQTLTDFWFLSPRQTLLRPDRSLCYGPESNLTCATCLGGNTRFYERLTRVLPKPLIAYGLLGASRIRPLARSPKLRGNAGDVKQRAAMLRQVFDQLDVAISPSEALREVFMRNGYPPNRIQLCRHGLDAGWLSKVHQRRPGDPLTFGFIGQLEPIKGADLLVQAFQALGEAVPCELKIFGSPTKNPEFSSQLHALANGNPRIQFMGAFDRSSQIADVYSQIDVAVVPSIWFENAPMVIPEAFGAGKPVIATNLGGMREAVQHDANGLLFELGDVDGLTGALRRLVQEPGLLEKLRRGIPPLRTIEDEAEALVRIYDQLCTSTAYVVSSESTEAIA